MKTRQRNGMTGARWRELKDRPTPRPTYLHISCQARMVPDPAGIHLPMMPWVARPGSTYNVGRNAWKRLKRARARQQRAAEL